MIRKMKKIVYAFISILFLFCLSTSCNNKNTLNKDKILLENDKNIVVLFTNDVHCNIDKNIGYAGLKYYKDSIDQNENYIALIDAGDFSQGSPFGTISKGKGIIEIMKKVGYDFCCPGNHEFDYGMQNFLSNCIDLNNIIYCCNFVDLRTKLPVLNPYKIMTLGNKRIAFIGAVTPETITLSTSDYFKDQNGNFIYSLSEDDTGALLYQSIQNAADNARLEGADYVILVGHLGKNSIEKKWTSEEVIKNTNNIDFVIDGHSHESYNEIVKNKDGKSIMVSQTGNNFKNIGKLIIDKKGNMNVENISIEDLSSSKDENGNFIIKRDPEITKFIENTVYRYEVVLNDIIVYDNQYDLITNDSETNERIIRKKETNFGDLIADAHRDQFQSDAVIIRSGSVLNDIKKGNITYNDCINALPFNNKAYLIKCKGQAIKDALEVGASLLPEENGDFFQVSGLTYTIDTSIKSKVIHDENGNVSFTSGDYRVRDIKINYLDIDLNKEYSLIISDYILANTETRFPMFKNIEFIPDKTMSDDDILINYLRKSGTNRYSNPYGNARIIIK